MRTLVLSPDFPPAPGGIQLLVQRIVRNASGLHCRIVTLDTPGAAEFDKTADMDIRRSPLIPAPRPISTLGLSGKALAEAFAYRPEAVLSAHLVMSPAASVIRRALGIPVVQLFYGHEMGIKPKLARFAARNADACVAISDYTHELVEAAGAPAEKIHLIHPGVDQPVRSDASSRDERRTVLTISRMQERYKGHDTMVRAMPLVRRQVPDARWVVIGDGPLRPAITELARCTGLADDAIAFLGSVSNKTRDWWLDRAHVFAMPSRLPPAGFHGEGFGIVYLEANSHGSPVLAGAVGGALDAVVDGETGLLVDPEDHIAVADALVDLLQHPTRSQEMGRAGALRATNFSWAVAGERLAALVASTGSGTGSRR